MLSGGHAENALPALATAVVNCRLLPMDKPAEVKRTLQEVLADPKIQLTEMKEPVTTPYTSDRSQSDGRGDREHGQALAGTAGGSHDGHRASDGIYLIRAGIPTYGVSGIFGDEDDVRAHGRNERILVKSFDDAVDFIYDLVTRLARSN